MRKLHSRAIEQKQKQVIWRKKVFLYPLCMRFGCIKAAGTYHLSIKVINMLEYATEDNFLNWML